MPLLEKDYCIEQINVPPKLPMILKQFCKSAIRTQPYDLLRWSSAYFHALARGEEPPSKLRMEYPPASSAHGLTLGFLKVLLRQCGDYNKIVPLESLWERWEYLCLDSRDFDMILRIGRFRKKCQIKKFLSIATGLLTCTVTETMILVCELFTYEPDGGSAMVHFSLFMEIYGYLAGLRCDGAEKSSEEICLCPVYKEPSVQSVEEPKEEPEAKPEPETKVEEKTEAPVRREVKIAPVSGESQDTDVDTDLDYESFEKVDRMSRITLQSFGEGMEENFIHEGEGEGEDEEEEEDLEEAASMNISESTPSIKEKNLDMVENLEEIKEESTDGETNKENQSAESVSSVAKHSGTGEETSYESSEVTESCDAFTHFPCIPGIGPQLLAEEVATVAIWMTECARRQEGMVGPRNIRHINCPSLTGVCHAVASTDCSVSTDS